MNSDEVERKLRDEIASLESELLRARTNLKAFTTSSSHESQQQQDASIILQDQSRHQTSTTHVLLLLSDSALPLGSFAFSSGLESYLAHRPPRPVPSILSFLSLSLSSVGSTLLPYLLTAFKEPTALASLDDTLDACTLCHVARRASIAQGRALLALWERAFSVTVDSEVPAALALAQFAKALKEGPESEFDGGVRGGHFAPIWGAVTVALGISITDSAYAFLLNHAKAVLSAAVRASLVGPYQAQSVLAGDWLRQKIAKSLEDNWEIHIDDAGQDVPLMDIWIGRHEKLYSRIFNS
ncbi:MAG: hypothetical protein Q9195_002593 [Heterodermia aff. obscurata]